MCLHHSFHWEHSWNCNRFSLFGGEYIGIWVVNRPTENANSGTSRFYGDSCPYCDLSFLMELISGHADDLRSSRWFFVAEMISRYRFPVKDIQYVIRISRSFFFDVRALWHFMVFHLSWWPRARGLAFEQEISPRHFMPRTKRVQNLICICLRWKARFILGRRRFFAVVTTLLNFHCYL